DGEDITLAEIQSFLRQMLPEYMLPGVLIVLDALPLSQSGKVNRRALPLPERTNHSKGSEFIGPRDEIEAKLCQIWEALLDVRPIGVRDSFFNLGGHSLLAIRMIAQVREKLGQDLNMLSLFQGPTIEQLADTIRRSSEVAAAVDRIAAVSQTVTHAEISEAQAADGYEKILIPLQPRGTLPPLYFVHPSGGSTHWYTELAAALGKDQPFYAFQARGVDGDRTIHTSIADMAECYVHALRRFQPAGPYQLGSWSLGVIIAYEMAQRLYAQGEQVSFLAMLDQGPAIPYPKPEDDADYFVQTFGKNIPLNIDALRQLSREEQIAYILEIGKKKRFIYPEIKLAEFSHFIHLLQTEVEAWRNYTVRPYPGKITLFGAAKQDHPAELGPDLGWGCLALGGMEIFNVSGDHLSMIHKPHVRKLAEAMKICLPSAEQITDRS
ncbi:MAG: alpha/beta fold hydrolase, partial [Chloroflexota bacterium]